MAEHFSLDYGSIDEVVKTFAAENGGLLISVKDVSPNQKMVEIKKGRSTGILNIYQTNKGLVSFNIQGSVSMNIDMVKCRNFIKNKTALPDSIKKSFTLKNCDLLSYDFLMSELGGRSQKWNVELKQDVKPPIFKQIKISNNNSNVVLTLYENGTVFLQGCVTPLYVDVMTTVLLCCTADDNAQTMDISNTVCKTDEDVNSHIPNIACLGAAESIIKVLIKSSLTLLNSGLVVSDYGCFAFGALKALEGVIKSRMQIDNPDVGSKSHPIGSYFNQDLSTLKWHFIPTINYYDSLPTLKSALEKGYLIYYNRRNTLFHVDYQVEMTCDMTYDEARTCVSEVLEVINFICTNW